jgi:hypothetical protein
MVDFERGDIGVSGPTTDDLFWDRAQQDPDVMPGFHHLIL